VRTDVALHDDLDPERVAARFEELTAQAAAALNAEGFDRDRHRYVRSADLRYLGQAYEVRVPVPDGPIDRDLLDAVATAFHAEHRALYGYDFAGDADQRVEWVNLRVSGIGPIRRPAIRRLPPAPESAPSGRRPVWFDAAAGPVEAELFWRPDLAPGQRVAGPAVIEEYGATVPVYPGYAAEVDPYGNLLVTRTD